MKMKKEIIICSCDIKRENGILIDSKCMHSTVLLGESRMMIRIREAMMRGYSDNVDSDITADSDNKLFGSWIEVKGDSIVVEEDAESAVLCSQLDQIDGMALTT